MPSGFALDYVAWVFLAALGTVQIAAARSGLAGLLFIRRAPSAAAVLGTLLIAAATAWFFGSEPRNLPDTGDGLDANSQARWFSAASAAAVAFSFAASSAVNHRWAVLRERESGAGDEPESRGLGRLRHTTFWRAVEHSAAPARRGRR